ncbi:methionine aminopeptidase 1B, chloroplastic-like, partial [Salvia hispanica]
MIAGDISLSSSTFSFHGDARLSASSTHLMGAPLASQSALPSQSAKLMRRLVVYSKRISGLEEAIRIRRERELRTSTTSKRRPPLRRGRVSPGLPVPDHIPRPPYVGTKLLPDIAEEHQIHDAEGLARLRAACELAARVVDYGGTLVRPSVTTNEIDKAVHQMIIDAGAYPSPLGYGGFPKSVCTSVNECMCHGIPDSRQLQDGDIINIDVTVYLNGYHGDTS